MRRILITVLISLVLVPASGYSQAWLTFKVKTSYPSGLTIQSKAKKYSNGEKVWSAAVDSTTTLVAQVHPEGLTQFIVQDANYVVSAWPQLEEGDSLVYVVDLDSATASVTYDKRGFHTIATNANASYWKYQRRADSASWVLPFSAFKSYTRDIENDLKRDMGPVLDSLRASGFYRSWLGTVADFRSYLLRRYLRREWKQSTSDYVNSPLTLKDYMPETPLEDQQYGRVFDDWLQIIIAENNARGKANTDSLQRVFLSSLSGRKRSLAFLSYARLRLNSHTSESSIHDLDSLASLCIVDEGIKQDYRAILEERLSIAEGRMAPDIALPDTNGVIRHLSDLRGHYVLLDFWGTWCGPCLEQLPFLDSLADHFAGTDLRVASIALEYKKVTVWKRFIAQKGLPGMHLYAEAQFNNDEVKKFGVDRSGVPAYYLIDPNGKILMSNSLRPSSPALWRMIEELLKGR